MWVKYACRYLAAGMHVVFEEMKNTLIHKQYWQSNKLFYVTPGDNL